MDTPLRPYSPLSFLKGPVFLWVLWTAVIGGVAWWYTRDLFIAQAVGGTGAIALLLHSIWLKVRLDSRWLVDLQVFLVRTGALSDQHRVKRIFMPWEAGAARRKFLASTLENVRDMEKRMHEARHALDKFVGTKASQFAAKYASGNQWGGEMVPVYVLFADVRGFTRMTEKLKPTETVTFLNRLFSALEEVVRESGGEVNKYIGDSILAFFPRSLEDEAPAVKRILLGALRMMDRFLEIDAKYKSDYSVTPEVGFGMGLAAGVAVLGNVGSMNRMEFTLVGDTVNTASRLCSIAEHGQILVNEEMARVAEGMFRMEALGAVKLKGKAEPVVPTVIMGEKLQPGLA